MLSITEKKNERLKVGKTKMTVDSVEGMETIEYPLHRTAHFYIFCSPPGGGKSNLITQMLTKKQFFKKKYEHVFFTSPSARTLKHFGLPKENIFETFDLARIQAQLDDVPPDHRVLMVFDDCVADLTKNNRQFLKMVYNRRHIGKGLSIWITTQKLSKVPLELRVAASGVMIFQTGNKERECVYDEYSTLDKAMFYTICTYCWNEPHSFMFIRNDLPEEKRYHKNFSPLSINGV